MKAWLRRKTYVKHRVTSKVASPPLDDTIIHVDNILRNRSSPSNHNLNKLNFGCLIDPSTSLKSAGSPSSDCRPIYIISRIRPEFPKEFPIKHNSVGPASDPTGSVVAGFCVCVDLPVGL